MELKLLFNVLKDRLWILLLAFGVGVVAALLLIGASPTIYESTAFFQIKKSSEPSLFLRNVPKEIGSLIYIDEDSIFENLTLFMKSEPLVQEAMEQAGLGEDVDIPPAKFAEVSAIGIMGQKRGVQIEAQEDSEVFTVKGLSPDIEEARRIANVFLNEFFRYYAQRKLDFLSETRATFVRKFTEAEGKLLAVERELVDYKKKNFLISVDTQRDQYLDTYKKLTEAGYDLLSQLDEYKKTYDELLRVIAKNPEYRKASETLDRNALIEYYIKEIASKQVSMATKLKDITPDHPDIIAAQESIEVLKRKMAEETEKVFASTVTSRNSYYDSLIEKRENYSMNIARIRANITSNEARLSELHRQLSKFLDLEEKYSELTRERSRIEAVYKELDDALKLLKVVEGVDISNFLLISPATTLADKSEYKYMPKSGLFLVVMVFLSVSAGLFLVFLLEYANNAVRLFPSFARLTEGLPVVQVQGAKGWSMLEAKMAEQGQGAPAAVLERKNRRTSRADFGDNAVRRYLGRGLAPLLVLAKGLRSAAPGGNVRQEDESNAHQAGAMAAETHWPVLVNYQPLDRSAAGYTLGGESGSVVYVAYDGEAGVEEIESDVRYFRDKGWESKVVCVFYTRTGLLGRLLERVRPRR
jgi:uncharacterized protein involved in exopolysaccharide biosynthesis